MKKIFASTLITIGIFSCKKQSEEVCYACTDASGTVVRETCGTSKEDARKNLTGGFNGTVYSYGTFPESEFNARCSKKP